MKLGALILLIAVSAGTAAPESWPFRKYPATVFHGKPGAPKLQTPLAKEHATIIRKAVIGGANFAGHYTVVHWGCGTSCGVYVIVDERTGRVFEPPEISKGVDLGVAGPEFRPDSTLMVVASCPPPEAYGLKNCKRKFYKWNGSRLILINTEPVTAVEKGR
jgi:hypothetical protein